MTAFEEFMQTMGETDEIKALTEMAKGNKEYEEKIIEFIKKNNIDCSRMWEDSKEGYKAHRDWLKLIEFALELIPEEEE